jgi:hypothetical protein
MALARILRAISSRHAHPQAWKHRVKVLFQMGEKAIAIAKKRQSPLIYAHPVKE